MLVSKDDVPVLFHDYTLNTNMVKDNAGNWIDNFDLKIRNLTYKEISKYSIESLNLEAKILIVLKSKICQRS